MLQYLLHSKYCGIIFALIFEGINDKSFVITRDPTDKETTGIADTLKDYDIIRDNRTAVMNGSIFEPDMYLDDCCTVLRCLASIPGNKIEATNISKLSVSWFKDEQEIVNTPNKYNITSQLVYSSQSNTNQFRTDFRIIPFDQSTDTGVYQCMFFGNDSDGEVLTTKPIRLDSRKSYLTIGMTLIHLLLHD